jgi:hypothetical protein
MRAVTRALASVLILSVFAHAQTLTLLTPVSSKMPSGTEFRAVDTSGNVYVGTVIARAARRFMRRGAVMLRFADPVHLVNSDPEGVIRPSHRRQIIFLGTTPLIAKIADDSVDGAIGGGKARFVALGAGLLFMSLMKGGDVHLKPGDKLEVQTGR